MKDKFNHYARINFVWYVYGGVSRVENKTKTTVPTSSSMAILYMPVLFRTNLNCCLMSSLKYLSKIYIWNIYIRKKSVPCFYSLNHSLIGQNIHCNLSLQVYMYNFTGRRTPVQLLFCKLFGNFWGHFL